MFLSSFTEMLIEIIYWKELFHVAINEIIYWNELFYIAINKII